MIILYPLPSTTVSRNRFHVTCPAFWAPETCICARGGKAIADFNPCEIAGHLPDNDVAMINGEKMALMDYGTSSE